MAEEAEAQATMVQEVALYMVQVAELQELQGEVGLGGGTLQEVADLQELVMAGLVVLALQETLAQGMEEEVVLAVPLQLGVKVEPEEHLAAEAVVEHIVHLDLMPAAQAA